jgi:transposase
MGMQSTSRPASSDVVRGGVLEVLRVLLADGRDDEVLEVVAKLVARNNQLERRLHALLSRRRKKEGISSAQLRLFLDALREVMPEDPDEGGKELLEANERLREASGMDEKKDGEKDEDPPKPRPKPPRRRPVPNKLRRVENPILVPEKERPCPKCGGERECIGHDVTEVIDLIPAEVVVREDRREKLACRKCDGELIRAPRGDKVVSGGKLGVTFVVQVMVEKYRDGLPLHRQAERFERLGLGIPVSTLADQVRWGAELMQPLQRAAMRQVLASTVMHLDGTGLPVLDRDCPKGKRTGTLWGYVGDENVALVLYTSTGKKVGQREDELGPEEVLKMRKGKVVADASNLFDASFKRGDLIECGCNAHARGYFRTALDREDNRAALPLAGYKRLYKIERELKDLEPKAKRAERQARSKPVFDAIVDWCEVYKPHEVPSSPLGEAIRYVLNHRVALGRFLEDGTVPIDNSIVERLHIRTALTRKAFLFAGSDAGGDRAAVAYTVLGCCALAGVDPVKYLADVLPRLARGVRECDVPNLLPHRWKEKRQAEVEADAEGEGDKGPAP